MGTITKDFSYREFEASSVAERKGICNVITSFAVRDAVKELTETVLQPLRDKVGHPEQRRSHNLPLLQGS